MSIGFVLHVCMLVFLELCSAIVLTPVFECILAPPVLTSRHIFTLVQCTIPSYYLHVQGTLCARDQPPLHSDLSSFQFVFALYSYVLSSHVPFCISISWHTVCTCTTHLVAVPTCPGSMFYCSLVLVSSGLSRPMHFCVQHALYTWHGGDWAPHPILQHVVDA